MSVFFSKLGKSKKTVLLIDYDGTLAPFCVERDKAVPYDGVRERLDAIIATGRMRVVVISGRWTRELIPLLGLKTLPEIWGCHGSERLMPDGTYYAVELSAEATRIFAESDKWLADEGLEEFSEKKPSSRALHLRGVEEDIAKKIKTKVIKAWGGIARMSELDLHEFDGGIELRVPGKNKGDAVNTIMSEAGEEAVVAYLGDDLTDEDAFEALKGRGLRVLVRWEFRSTAADIWITPPGELLEFLDKWRNACG